MAFGWDDLAYLALSAYEAYAGGKAANQTSKVETTAAAVGAPSTATQSIFGTGIPTKQPFEVPALDVPGAQASINPNQFMAMAQASPGWGGQGVAQPMSQPSIANSLSGLKDEQLSPINITAQKLPIPGAQPGADAQGFDWGRALGYTGDISKALAAAAPLLGLGPKPEKKIVTAGAAGGSGGQSVFPMPQGRMTLAQILASLPRMM